MRPSVVIAPTRVDLLQHLLDIGRGSAKGRETIQWVDRGPIGDEVALDRLAHPGAGREMPTAGGSSDVLLEVIGDDDLETATHG